ncbi:MAG: tRNA threonylcarbamoyladenosine dehydratase [Leptothrix sp. (in: Bacteria)]|nr:tRNA threonylcarbamoyladenosine dehydratase [Leptothrix sp. (in: b-proteobacteria)]
MPSMQVLSAGLVGTADPNEDADLERRFGGLRRLYGDAAYRRVRGARIGVVGLGGVGSWTAEALARSGVAALVLIDLDHITESNINRQVQASSNTLGQHKGLALRERIAGIHPGCEVSVVDAFVEPGNWPALLPGRVDALVDACDRVRAKVALAAWAFATGVPLVCVGAAGGKRSPQRVEVEDLADTTHDPLLAGLRQRLRKQAGAPRSGRMGLRCVFSRESVAAPADGCASDGSLNCAGYGSSVTVTATFGMVAAAEVLAQLMAGAIESA